MNIRRKNKAFTLIEMIIAVFIFVILFLIAASFVNLAVGSTKSVRTKLLTSDLRNTMDLINQKMNNANSKVRVGISSSDPIPTIDNIYGFRVVTTDGGAKVLVISSSDGSCTFIGKLTTNNLGTIVSGKRNSCDNQRPVPEPGNANEFAQKLTPLSVNVASLDFHAGPPLEAGYTMIDTNPTQAPYLEIVIKAQDADDKWKDDNQIQLKTSYTMDYQTIRRLKNMTEHGT